MSKFEKLFKIHRGFMIFKSWSHIYVNDKSNGCLCCFCVLATNVQQFQLNRQEPESNTI